MNEGVEARPKKRKTPEDRDLALEKLGLQLRHGYDGALYRAQRPRGKSGCDSPVAPELAMSLQLANWPDLVPHRDTKTARARGSDCGSFFDKLGPQQASAKGKTL